ncbi:MAG: hypothetical protein AAFN79_15430 [Pseudomonadota bacterium]
MKDLIQFIGGGLKDYLPLLVRIVAHPRTNIRTLATKPEPLHQAVMFFGVTLAIVLLLNAPLLMSDGDFLPKIGVLAAYKLIEVALSALACVAVFRLLRGVAGYEPTLAAILYIFSPAYLLLMFTHLFATGVIASVHPDLAEAHLRTGDLSQGSYDAIAEIDISVSLIIFGASVIVLCAVFLWLAICWRVFAELNGFGRLRTIASFALCMAAMFAVSELCALIVRGVYPQGLGVFL